MSWLFSQAQSVTAASATVSFAAMHSDRGIKVRYRSAALIRAEAHCKHKRRSGNAPYVGTNLSRRGQHTKRAQESAGLSTGFQGNPLTLWSRFDSGWRSFAAPASLGACVTRRTERRLFSVTQQMIFALILRRTSSLGCRGTTTERAQTNGV